MRTRTVTWAELRVGLLVLITVAILSTAIIILGKKANIFTRKYSLRTYLNRVEGLTVGAPVWLAGVEVGNVKKISFTGLKQGGLIEVTMNINRNVESLIRKDSVALITSKGLLGDKIIYLSIGSPEEPVVAHGGVLQSQEFTDISGLMDKLSTSLTRLTSAAERIDRFTNQLKGFAERADSILSNVESGKGNLGRLLKDEELFFNLKRAITNLNSILSDLNSDNGTLGKLLRDPTLYVRLNQSAERLNDLLANIEKGGGTLGRLIEDEKLYDELRDATQSFKKLMEEIKENPKKYLNLKVF